MRISITYHMILIIILVGFSGNIYARGKTKTNSETKIIGGIEFVKIKAGSFTMGSSFYFLNEEPPHKVYVDSFWIGKYEVTQSQYESIMRRNRSWFKGSSRPVEWVSWHDAIEFCKKFSRRYGVKVRLPYEAEWEYAARAGTTSLFYWGDVMKGAYSWYGKNSGRQTHPVGQKKPNRWGLFDMHGNVYEWCMDLYSRNYYRISPSSNPKGPSLGKFRVLRGGSWSARDDLLRSAYRIPVRPVRNYYAFGFRVLLMDQ